MEEEAEFNISEDEEREVLKSVKEFIDRNADMHSAKSVSIPWTSYIIEALEVRVGKRR